MAYDLQAALQQFGYNDSRPRQGESSYQFYERKRREYDANVSQQQQVARSIHDMEAQRTNQRNYENELRSRGLWDPSGTESSAAENDAKLERERQLAFGALESQKSFYDQGGAAELEQSLLGNMRGTSSPFSPQVVDGLIGRETDAEAGQLRSEQNMIRSRMANSGLGGSGLDTSARINAQRAASKRSRGASRDIRTRAELENFQAQERAQQRYSSFIAQEASNRAAATKQEVDLRSRFQVLGDDRGMDKLAAALAPKNMGPAAPQLPIQERGSITGNNAKKSQYGGVTWLDGRGVGPFRQTSGGKGGYPQFGLGGANGPFSAIANSGRAASYNMQNPGYASQNSYSSGRGRSQAYSPDGNGPLSLWDQLQQNAVPGSATPTGSREHWAWQSERDRRFGKGN